MVYFELSIKNFDWHLISATIVQKRQSGLFHYAFVRLVFELVAARFYAFVEAAKKVSH